MIILGSTGSIGINALKVAKQFNIQIEALVCGGNITLLNEQIKEFKPRFVGIANLHNHNLLNPNDSTVFLGEEGICMMLEKCKTQKVLNAIVGFAGLQFSLKTLELQKDLLLANKESLVIAGNLLWQKSMILNNLPNNTPPSQDTNTLLQRIFPIDSEHFSLYSLLYHNQEASAIKTDSIQKKQFQRLYITASGGALRDFPLEKIKDATPQYVLQHPTWKMGKKITIDSATLVNKLYEILEAYWLFNTKQIDAFIERSSLIHALIEHKDGTINAHISHADMCLPIAYGLDSKKALETFTLKHLSIQELMQIRLQEIDVNRYPLWEYKDLLLSYPSLGVALNASNEILQDYFLQEKLPFCAFWHIIAQVLTHFTTTKTPQTLEEIFELREEVKTFSYFLLKKHYSIEYLN